MASDQLTQKMANLTLSKQPRKKAPLIDFSATHQDILNYAHHLLSKYKDVVEFKKETQLSYNVKNENRGSDQENGHDWTQMTQIRKAKDFQLMKSETDRISKNCQHKYNNSVQKPKYDHWSLMRVICEEDQNEHKGTKDEDLVSVSIDHKGKKIFDLSMGVVQARYHHNKWIETLKKYKETIENYFDNPANVNLTASGQVPKPNGLPFCEAEDLFTIKKLLRLPQTSTENDIPCLSEEQKMKLNEWFSGEFIEIIHTPASSPRNSDTQPSSGRADSPSRTKNERNEMRRLNDTLATPTKMSANNSGRQSGSGSDRSGSDREKENKENNVPNENQNKPKVKGLLDTPDKAMLWDNRSRLDMIPQPREMREQWRNNGITNRRVSDPEALISPPSMSFRPRNHKIAEEKPKNPIVPSENPNPKILNQNINREPEGRVPFTKVQNRYQNNRFQSQHSNNSLQNRSRNHNGYNNYNNNNNGKQQIVNPKTGYQPRNTTASNQVSNFQVPALPGNNENLTKMSNSNTSLKENNPVTIASSNFSTKAEPFRPKNVSQAGTAAAAAAVPVPENQTTSKKIDLKKLNVSTIAAFVPRNPLVAVQNN